LCAVKHKVAIWSAYALFSDRPHFALLQFCDGHLMQRYSLAKPTPEQTTEAG